MPAVRCNLKSNTFFEYPFKLNLKKNKQYVIWFCQSDIVMKPFTCIV